MASTYETPRALELGMLLRRFRTRAGLSLEGLGAQIGRHHSEISRVERAQRGLDEVFLGAILGAVGVSPEEREEVQALFQAATDPNWLAAGQSKQLAVIRSYEDAADQIFTWQPSLIPGPLQKRSYAEAVILARGRSKADAVEGADVRMARADKILSGDIKYTAIIGEQALRYPPCDTDVALDQLHHLRKVSELPSVTVRAIPLNSKLLLTRYGPFVLIESVRAGTSVVHLEQVEGSATLTDAKYVRGYKLAADSLLRAAMSTEETSGLIGDVTDEMERTT